jgi:hypothetical protein
VFDTYLKSTGRDYTKTVALLVIAVIFIPALLLVSGSSGYLSFSLAISGAAICVAFAWVSWKRSSQLSVASIGTRRVEPK